MPYALDTHVLTVDANVIHKVDTANPYNLFSMWTVFSRCAESVEQGRRLENLSWRLWNSQSQTTRLGGNKSRTTSATRSIRPKDITPEIVDQVVPPLSASVDSVPDDEALEFVSGSSPLEIRPRIRREDSCASRRDRIKDEFEKMVVSIITSKELDTAPRKESIDQATFERSGSTTDESPSKSSEEPSETSQQPSSPEMTSHTTVVRGFSPSSTVSRSVSQRSSPESVEARVLPQRLAVSKKPPPTFRFVSSCSSSEQNQSVDNHKPMQKPGRRVFQVGPAGSSDEESSIRSALHSPPQCPQLDSQKKQTSFSNQVTVAEAAIDDSETEADDVDESAIDDDDDSSEWEDSVEDSGKSSIDEKTYFQRVDSSANLASRRSLLTLMLEQNTDRSKKLGNGASQSTSAIARQRGNPKGPSLGASPNDSDDNPLMMKQGSRSTTLKPINEVPRSAAQPIVTMNNQGYFQAALSPRTTRRNMLATELTESLRRHLLWERQQKSSTANAVLKRRHTSHDVANLKQYPDKAYMNKNEDANASSWNQVFAKEAFGDYNSQGW